MKVEQILFLKVKPGDLWNLDRPQGSVVGGGGQTYINFGNVPKETIESFFNQNFNDEGNIQVYVNSVYAGQQGLEVIINSRTGIRTDFRITNQAAHQNRHPSWTNQVGFPELPEGVIGAEGVKKQGVVDETWFYFFKSIGEFYAGYTETEQVEELLKIEWQTSIINFPEKVVFIDCDEESELSQDIQSKLGSLEENPNVLLYGAPGTGKTYFMQQMYNQLCNLGSEVIVDTSISSGPSEFKIKTSSVGVDWVTFHQNYEYEQFVIGKQVDSNSAGESNKLVNLKDKMGVFLNAAANVYPLKRVKESYVFIDEFNRGNASKIFGQLITFLEMDKRYDSRLNYVMPFPLPEISVNLDNNEYSPVENTYGEKIKFPYPYYLPKKIYIVASMNSSDKAVAPLDMAFSRRFNKVDFRTDYSVLEKISITNNADGINPIDNIAINLVKRINQYILSEYGKDFELGQSYIFDVILANNKNEKVEKLINTWEKKILPQFLLFFDEKSNVLIDFLRFEDSSIIPNYPFKIMNSIVGDDEYVEIGKVNTQQEYLNLLEFLSNGE